MSAAEDSCRVCDYCFREFRNKKDHLLVLHLATNHQQHIQKSNSDATFLSSIEKLTCEDCGQAMAAGRPESRQRPALWKHQLRYHARSSSARDVRAEFLVENKQKSAELFLKNKQQVPFCDECSRNFSSRAYLARHISSAHQPERILVECDDCNASGMSPKDLWRHQLLRHAASPTAKELAEAQLREIQLQDNKSQNYFECDECSKCFTQKHILKRHASAHNLNFKETSIDIISDTMTCEDCGFEVRVDIKENKQREALWAHQLRRHASSKAAKEALRCKKLACAKTKPGRGTLTCDLCIKRISRDGMTWHLAAIHPSVLNVPVKKQAYKRMSESIICDVCLHTKLRPRNHADLAKHILTQHMPKLSHPLSLTCDQCGYRGSRSQCMTNHFQYAHTLERQQAKPTTTKTKTACDLCPTKARPGQLWRPWLAVHAEPPNRRKFSLPKQKRFCDICSSGVNNKTSLKHHLSVKHGLRCACACDAKRAISATDPERGKTCEECGARKKGGSDALWRHWLSKHSGATLSKPPSTAPPVRCDQCHEHFTTKYSLQQRCSKKHGNDGN